MKLSKGLSGLLLCVIALPPAFSAPDQRAFDLLYEQFVEERNDVQHGSAALAFLNRINAKMPPGDERRRLQRDLVACFYGTLDDLPAQQSLGEQGYNRAMAQSQYREAGLFRICQGHASEMLEGSSHALPLFREAVSLAEKSGDLYSAAISKFWLASALSALGHSGEALILFTQAQDEFLAIGRPRRARSLDIDIGILHRRIGRPERAAEIFSGIQADTAWAEHAALEDQLAILLQHGIALADMERWEEALDQFAATERKLADTQLPTWQRAVRAAPVAALNSLGRHDEALARLDQAKKLHTEIGGRQMAEFQLRRAEAKLGLGQVEIALNLLESLDGASDLADSPALNLQLHLLSARALAAADLHAEAYKRLLDVRRLEQSLLKENNAQQLVALQAAYDARDRARMVEQARTLADLRETEIAVLKQVQTWQQIAISVLVLFLFALLVWSSLQHGQRRRMTKLAWHDPLTGLLNRRGFQNAAEPALNVEPLEDQLPALLIMDLDHFKQVNDRYGHPAGDQVLTSVATVLRSSARENDLIGRIGGEEFALVLSAATRTEAVAVAERIRCAVLETHFGSVAPDLTLSCSIGVATADETENGKLSDLMIIADRRLYAAKAAGRNRVVANSECG